MAITKVFKSGNSQAVRIPRDFQIDSEEVEIVRRGDEIVIRKPRRNLADLYDVLTSFSEDFLQDGRNQAPPQKRRGL